MLQIEAESLGKKFMRRFVFKNFNYQFTEGHAYAVTGSNGSGKSTLLQILCGYMMPSQGKVKFREDGALIEEESHFKYCSFASPFMELIEEYTVSEMIAFHSKLKPMLISENSEIAKAFQLENELQKPIKYLSSGNKQRVKLSLAFCSVTKALFLDEPTQNLDNKGVDLYLNAIENFAKNRLIIVSSNDEREYSFCDEIIKIEDYK
jgi:ABC-type multidrug transport system ATPase subunit